MILRKSPYGDINAAEAVRHAMGGVTDDFKISLVLLDSGVLLAKKGHDVSDTGFINLQAALTDCIGLGVEVYADRASVREEYLEVSDMVDDVKVVNGYDIAEIVKEADTAMIF